MKNKLFRDNQKENTILPQAAMIKVTKSSQTKFLESINSLSSKSYKERYRREATHLCL